jgi:hypothetical protein
MPFKGCGRIWSAAILCQSIFGICGLLSACKGSVLENTGCNSYWIELNILLLYQ